MDDNIARLLGIANDGKSLHSFVEGTIKQYRNLSVRLHETACIALFHTLQFREASALNAFSNGLRVNDATALRLWIKKHTLAPGNTDFNPNEEAQTFIGWTKKKGFFVRKGLKSEDAWELANLLQVDPFFNKNVQDKDALDLVKLLKALKQAAGRATKQADENDIQLTRPLESILKELVNECDLAIAANDDGMGEARSNVA